MDNSFTKKETLRSRFDKFLFNQFPCYRRTGAKIVFVSGDYKNVEIELRLNWKTRNYGGTIFGGSIFGACDPVHMIMLIKILGRGYTAVDKAASIRYLRPATGRLSAKFHIGDEEIHSIKDALQSNEKIDRNYTVSFFDDKDVKCAEIEKVVHIRKRQKRVK